MVKKEQDKKKPLPNLTWEPWDQEALSRRIAAANVSETPVNIPRHFGFNHLIRVIEQRQQQELGGEPSTAPSTAGGGGITSLQEVVSSSENGVLVQGFDGLVDPDRYLILPIQARHSCFVLRRHGYVNSRQLQVQEWKFRATVRTVFTSMPLRLSELSGGLYNLFSYLYRNVQQELMVRDFFFGMQQTHPCVFFFSRRFETLFFFLSLTLAGHL